MERRSVRKKSKTLFQIGGIFFIISKHNYAELRSNDLRWKKKTKHFMFPKGNGKEYFHEKEHETLYRIIQDSSQGMSRKNRNSMREKKNRKSSQSKVFFHVTCFVMLAYKSKETTIKLHMAVSHVFSCPKIGLSKTHVNLQGFSSSGSKAISKIGLLISGIENHINSQGLAPFVTEDNGTNEKLPIYKRNC